MKIGIAFPIYHANRLHADFTRQTIESISSSDHEISVYPVVNYSTNEFLPVKENYKLHDSIKHFEVMLNLKGNHVGAAWNQGIKKALQDGCEYVFVPNNDIIFHKTAIDRLITFAQEHPEFIFWTSAPWDNLRTIRSIDAAAFGDSFDEHPHFSCFMLSQKTMDTVGWFDENLKMAYHEDGDYHYRIILSGNKAAKTAFSRFYHYGSRTIKVDEALNEKNVRSYEYNRAYIKRKWNLDFHDKAYHPPEEILKVEGAYKHPFNNKERNWRNCDE